MEVNDQVSRPRVVRKPKNSIPEELLNNVELNNAISVLPRNYNFEIHKSIWKVLQEKPEITALQFPEGLLMYVTIPTFEAHTHFYAIGFVLIKGMHV